MLCHLLMLTMDVVDIPVGTSCATCIELQFEVVCTNAYSIAGAKTESDTTCCPCMVIL